MTVLLAAPRKVRAVATCRRSCVTVSHHRRLARLIDVRPSAHRWALVGLIVVAGFVGPWAMVSPREFFASFPGGGRAWIAADGPYNEHLVRDVGALHVALLVLAVGATLRPDRLLVRMTALVWLTFSVPHLAYHLAHLNLYAVADRLVHTLALSVPVVLAAALCLPDRRDGTGLEGSGGLDQDSGVGRVSGSGAAP